MKVENVLVLAALGVGLWLLFRAKEQLSRGADTVADWIARAWMAFDDLLPGQGGIQLQGNVSFNGTLVSLQQLANARAVKSDPNTGNVYAHYAGRFWQLAPSDASGNWPATVIG